MEKSLDNLFKKGQEFLQVQVPIMGGAMTWVSESNLVAAVSNAGSFGVLATGSMNKEMLEQAIIQTKQKTSKPFGVNIILLNPNYNDLIETCIKHKISHIILAGGIPTDVQVNTIIQANIAAIAFAPNLSIAKRLIKHKISALIIEGNEAGGHIGPVSTMVLVQEILLNIKEVPIFVAGGIGTGETMLSLLKLGAAGVQIGTVLVCSTECIAHDNFKQAFIKASARDAQPTVQIDNAFPVVPVRAIINKGSLEFVDFQKQVIKDFKEGKILDKKDAQLKIEHYWAGSLKKAVIDGDVEYGSLMAGQSVGLVNKILPVKEILNNFVNQANDCIKTNL